MICCTLDVIGWKWSLILCLPPKTHHPVSSWEKYQANSNREHPTKSWPAGCPGSHFNPSTLWGQGRQIIWVQELETSLANTVKPLFSTKRRLKRENCFNPGGRGCSELRSYIPLHSSPGDRVRLHLKKKGKRNEGRSLVRYRIARQLLRGFED